MLDLGKFLRDRKKDVVNQWQNSTVLDAVSANTQADKARRVQAGQPQQFQGNAVARGITNLVGANKMKDTSVQDAADDEAFRNDLKNIINLRTSGQITPGQAQAKAINVAPTGNTDYTKDVLNNQANRSGVGQAILPALGTFAKPFATGLSDIGTAVGTGVEAFTPFNGVGKNIADASKRQSQGIEDLYRASSFNGGQEGENRLVTGVSSGLGSLASSLAAGATGGLKSGVGMKLSTGGRQLLNPTTMSGLQFGLSAGAGQMRDATDNGKSAGQAFGTGLVAGGVEAGLEKVGLDKYLGAGGNFLRKTGTRMLTEGLQEGSQSLAQSLVSGTFKHVNPVDALKQAALEGGMGGLVGGIGGVGGDIALNLQQKQNAPKAPQQVKQEVVAKSPVLQQTGIPVTPGSLRERIQLAKDSVANKIAGNSLMQNQVGAIPNPAYRAPFTQGEPGAELLNIQNPLGAKQGVPITNELGATIRKPVKTNTGSTLVGPSTPNQPKLKITDANNQSTYIDPAKLRGVARQSYESKRGQVNNQDTNYDPKVSIRMQKDYIEGRTPVKGDATTGEGAQLPSKGMTKEQKQSLIDKARAEVLKQEVSTPTLKNALSYPHTPWDDVDTSGISVTKSKIFKGNEYVTKNGKLIAVIGDGTTSNDAQNIYRGLKGKTDPADIELYNTEFPQPKPSLKDNQSGSVQIPKVLTNISERIRNSSLAKNEGGYAKNPFYDKKNDIAQDLTPEQSDFINNYANMLEDMGSGNGVTVNPETNQRVSSNFRDAELGSGKVSKAEWFDQARKELESGKGAYGASEEYKALATPQVGKTDPLEALKAEARKYKSAELTDGKTYIKDGYADPKDVLVVADAKRLQELGNKSRANFGAKDQVTRLDSGDKLSRFEDFYKNNNRIKAPALATRSDGSIAGFEGNHRLRVLSDKNNGKVVVSVSPESIDVLKKQGVVTDLYNQAKAPQVGKTDFKYKNETSTGTAQFNELTPNNSFQDINGERHPFQSDAKITIKNYDGTNETKTITVKDIGSQKYFNDQLIRYGERGEIMGVNVDQSPALVTQKSSSKTKSPKPPVQDLPSISTRIAESKQKVQTSQSPVLPQEIQSTDTSASRLSNKASTTPNTANDTTGDALSAENFAKTFGGTVKQAEKTLSDTPRFDAATRTDKGKDANKLFESMKTDAKINQATKEAQASGKELNFYAKKDVNGRSVGIEQFDPKRHRIEAGFVVDEQQNILGNHIKVDANGIQVNVGGKVVNMDSILGNPLDWGSTSTTDKAKKGRYKLSETMNRNIDNNAPSKEIANKTKNFLWSNKVKAEADMRTELEAEYKALGDRIKRTNKAKPLGVSKTQYQDDIFAVLNGDKTDAEIKSAYKENTANAILDYKKETRTLYDSLLQRVNTERVKFGQPEIQARKDYITHLQELNGNKGFVAEVYGQMKNSFADEGMGKTRNGVPGDIAGRTENFKPISKYNPFLQRRTGTKSLRDPYMAVQEYLQPALYNIHMTESGARARAIETAFRTAEQIKNTEPRTVLDEAKKITDKYKSDSDNAKLITGFQEYANAIAGKTQRFDRQVVDSSDTAAKGLKGWQALQRTGGRATILGNVSSMLAQPLNQVVGLADAGPVTYMKGIASAVAGDPAIEKSAFIKARETEPTKAIRTKGEKVLDSGSIPLQKVELASVKLMWHTQYQKALSQGLKGQEAIQQADLGTERLAAGRGIADKPELYRSTVANGVLQYTLEVNAQNKAFWQDLSPKQKATFLVASTATNTLMGAITGFEPLPDFLKAMFETGKDILDGEDDQNIGQELVQGGQRMLDQYARMNPLLGAPVNLLPQAQRKAIFGQDSDTGRFSGSTAPVQVVTNAVKAASDVTKGNYKSARDNILRDVPFGNQIRKTLTGAEMINRGYAVDSSGKKTFDAPTSPLGKAQALAFGPSATKPAREYYDKGTSESSGKSVATKDAQGNETTKDDFESISKAAFNSPKGKEFIALKNEDERKEYARQSPDNRQIYNDYKAMQKAFNGGDKLLAPGLDETSTKTLNKYDRMTPKAKENIFNRNKSAEYEYELASYNNKKANGETNLVDEINGQQRLSKLRATKDFDKAYRDLYSGLSKTEVYDLITSNPDGKKIAEQLLAIDDALVKAGNKAKFRDKYGNVTFAPKTSSGGRGGRSAKSQSQSEVNNLTQDTLSKLNSLLAGAQKPVKGVKKVATAKPTLKKITVKK